MSMPIWSHLKNFWLRCGRPESNTFNTWCSMSKNAAEFRMVGILHVLDIQNLFFNFEVHSN